MASYEDEAWLEQCCASLAEQLRVAQAENVELQKTVEELRGDSSGQSSPMAWDNTRTGSGNFENALEMETSSQGSRQSRVSSHLRIEAVITIACRGSSVKSAGMQWWTCRLDLYARIIMGIVCEW